MTDPLMLHMLAKNKSHKYQSSDSILIAGRFHSWGFFSLPTIAICGQAQESALELAHQAAPCPVSSPRDGDLTQFGQINSAQSYWDRIYPIFNLVENQQNDRFQKIVKPKNGNEVEIQMQAMDFNMYEWFLMFL